MNDFHILILFSQLLTWWEKIFFRCSSKVYSNLPWFVHLEHKNTIIKRFLKNIEIWFCLWKILNYLFHVMFVLFKWLRKLFESLTHTTATTRDDEERLMSERSCVQCVGRVLYKWTSSWLKWREVLMPILRCIKHHSIKAE